MEEEGDEEEDGFTGVRGVTTPDVRPWSHIPGYFINTGRTSTTCETLFFFDKSRRYAVAEIHTKEGMVG